MMLPTAQTARTGHDNWLYITSPESVEAILALVFCVVATWILGRPKSRYTLDRQFACCSAACAAFIATLTMYLLPLHTQFYQDLLYSVPAWNTAQSITIAFGLYFALSGFRGPSILIGVLSFTVLVPTVFVGLLLLGAAVDFLTGAEYQRDLDMKELWSRIIICIATIALLAEFARSIVRYPRARPGVYGYSALLAIVLCGLLSVGIYLEYWIESYARHIFFYEIDPRTLLCSLSTVLLAIFALPYIDWCRQRSIYMWRCHQGRCPHCAYDLRGSVGQADCPECGRVIPWERVVLPAD